MSLTLDLPAPLNEALAQEAAREGITPEEHAILLIILANALLADEEPHAFPRTVREVLRRHSLDAERVSSVLEGLMQEGLAALHEAGKESTIFQNGMQEQDSGSEPGVADLSTPVQAWKEVLCHRTGPIQHPVDVSADVVLSPVEPVDRVIQRPGRVKRPSAFGKYAGILASAEEFMREKRDEIAREDREEA